MKTNKELSDWFLTLILTTLLSLILAGRGDETVYLEVRHIKKRENSIIFYFYKIIQSWKQGKSARKVEFFVFPKDR